MVYICTYNIIISKSGVIYQVHGSTHYYIINVRNNSHFFTSTGKVSRLRNTEEGFFKSRVVTFRQKIDSAEQTEFRLRHRKKTSKFRSEPFRGKGKTLGIPFWNLKPSRTRKTLRISFWAPQGREKLSVSVGYGSTYRGHESAILVHERGKVKIASLASGHVFSSQHSTGIAPSPQSWKPNGETKLVSM